MTLAMMVMIICSTIISRTSNISSSGSRWAKTKTKTFLEWPGWNLFRTVEKSWKIKPFRHSRAKKKPHFDHFPRPGEIDPYIAIWLKRLGNKAQNRLQEFLRSRMGWMGSHPLDCYYFYRTCGAKKEKSGTWKWYFPTCKIFLHHHPFCRGWTSQHILKQIF